MSLFEAYRNKLVESINLIDESAVLKVAAKLDSARREGKRVFIIGNGGSAAIASHFACDLGKGCYREGEANFKVTSLTDNVPWMTALSNDLSYEHVFVNQLKNFAEEGDLLIAISSSGSSKNIIKACEYAKETGLCVIGFVGFQGGRLKEIADISIWIESDDYGIVEDCHSVLEHVISHLIRKM